MPGRKKDVFGVTVEGDISGLQRAMYEAEKLFKDTEKALQNVNKQAKLEPQNTDVLKQQMELYRDSISEAGNAIRKLKRDRDKLIKEATQKGVLDEVMNSRKMTDLNLEISKMEKHLKDLKKEYKDLGNVAGQVFDSKLTNYYHSLDANFEAYARNVEALQNLAKSIELDPSNIDLYRQYQEQLNNVIRIGTFIQEKYNKETEKIRNTPGYVAGVVETSEKFTNLQKDVAQATKEVKEYDKLRMSEGQMRFNKQLEITSNAMLDISRATARMSRAFQGLLSTSFNASKQMETDIANIRRVVGDISDETIDDLKELAVQTGTTFTEISDYASIAGALGLAEDQIAQFSKTMVDLNTATGGVFTGEEGAKGIAVFLKQLNLGIEEAENFGSAIAVVGANYADIGDETINVATKLTGLTSIVKTDQYELLGLAAVMSDLGLSADSNANAINRAFLAITNIIADTSKKGKQKLATLAETAGMTSKQFKEAWGEDALEAFLRFTDGLKSSVFNEINNSINNSTNKVNEYADALGWSADLFKEKWGEDSQAVFQLYIDSLDEMTEDGESAATVLKAVGLNTINTAQTMLRLSGSGNEVRKAIGLVDEAWNENIALTESAGIVYDTTERKLNGAYEALKQLGGSLIDEFAPTIKGMAENLTVFAKSLSNVNPTVKKLITYFMAFSAGLSPVARNLGNLGLWFVKNQKGVSKFSRSLEGLATIIKSPVGVAAAIGLLAAGIYELDKYSKSHSIYYKLTEDVKSLGTEMENVSNKADETFATMMDGLFDGTEEYVGKIDELFSTYMDKSLSWKERKEAKDQIQEYVDALNTMLGDEVVAFDYANGKLLFQKETIDDIKTAFADYQFEITKQNWLDAHKEELDFATSSMKETQKELADVTREFLDQTTGVPQWVMDILTDNEMDIKAVENAFKEKGIFGTGGSEEILNTLRNALGNYVPVAEKADDAIQKFQEYIDSYKEVENATEDNFSEIVANIEQQNEDVSSQLDLINKSAEDLIEERNVLAALFGDDSDIVRAYDQEIEKLQVQDEWVKQQVESWNNVYNEVDKIKAGWDTWIPTDKEAMFMIGIEGSKPQWMKDLANSIGSNMFNSGGYAGIFDSLSRSLISSGGYSSGGVMTFNNTININGINAIDATTANLLGDLVTERVNENLGRAV